MTFPWLHSPTESTCEWRGLRAVVTAASLYRYEAVVYDGVEVVWSSKDVVAQSRESAMRLCENEMRLRRVEEVKEVVRGLKSYGIGKHTWA